MGICEKLNNENFDSVEFDTFKNEVGHNYFTMTSKKWIENIKAIGLKLKVGKYDSGTCAHKDIALHFA